MHCANFTKFVAVPLTCAVVLTASVATRGQTAPPKTASKTKAAAKVMVDLNKASAEELEENLSGVGPATAKKIIAGRPYTTVDDLAKAGVTRRVIEAIRPQVSVGAAMADEPKAAKSKATKAKTAGSKVDEPKESPAGKVDLNLADAAALEALPGVGTAVAKAIIAGRPWKSVDDLEKIRGLGKNRIAALRDLVTAGDEQAPVAAKKAAAPTVTTKQSTPRTAAAKSGSTKAMTKLQPGEKININTATKEELDVLPGIGPVRAQAIIDGRPFKTIEDIKNVKGIKEVEFSKIQDMITVQ